MTDFYILYNTLVEQMNGNQKRIHVDSVLAVYFGYNKNKQLRLSFSSKMTAPEMKSTKILNVSQAREDNNTYWTSFDLMDPDGKDVYCSFCENMIDSIVHIESETVALNRLRVRYSTWKALFQKNTQTSMSKETMMGLFGELLVLRDITIPKYGIETAIRGWGGPDMQSKDFTIDNTWYEVKTIGTSVDKIKISSLTQLSSELEGHLIVIKVEELSLAVKEQGLSLFALIKEILNEITSDITEEIYLQKLKSIGISVLDTEIDRVFDVKKVTMYLVNNKFPRILANDVKYSEITDITYTISVAAIAPYLEHSCNSEITSIE